jgi:hypothetical protein
MVFVNPDASTFVEMIQNSLYQFACDIEYPQKLHNVEMKVAERQLFFWSYSSVRLPGQ